MGFEIQKQEEAAALIPKSATPIEPEGTSAVEVRRSFFRTIGVWIGLIRDYTAEDLGRLKEAGVQKIEGEARKANADAELKLAEAAERQAKAALTRAQIEKLRNDAKVQLINSRGEYTKNVAEAVERVSNAICAIKQKGGTVSFDEKELLALFERGLKEYPNDPLLLEEEKKISQDQERL